MTKVNNIKTRFLGNSDYTSVWNKMKNFTYSRDNETEDELWVTEHFPIYTLGNKVKNTRINKSSNIPLLRVDRGGKRREVKTNHKRYTKMSCLCKRKNATRKTFQHVGKIRDKGGCN